MAQIRNKFGLGVSLAKFLSLANGYFLFEKKGVGVSRANIEKYLGTFLLFHLRMGWVGGKIGIFEKYHMFHILRYNVMCQVIKNSTF